jgi:hypothetical protein
LIRLWNRVTRLQDRHTRSWSRIAQRVFAGQRRLRGYALFMHESARGCVISGWPSGPARAPVLGRVVHGASLTRGLTGDRLKQQQEAWLVRSVAQVAHARLDGRRSRRRGGLVCGWGFHVVRGRGIDDSGYWSAAAPRSADGPRRPSRAPVFRIARRRLVVLACGTMRR